MPDGGRFRADLDAVLDDLTSRGAEVMLLEIRARDPRGLLRHGAHVSLLTVE
jgi:hypothetical protein